MFYDGGTGEAGWRGKRWEGRGERAGEKGTGGVGMDEGRKREEGGAWREEGGACEREEGAGEGGWGEGGGRVEGRGNFLVQVGEPHPPSPLAAPDPLSPPFPTPALNPHPSAAHVPLATTPLKEWGGRVEKEGGVGGGRTLLGARS